MDAADFSYTLSLVRGFPVRTFDRETQSWIISTTQSNLDYLKRMFKDEEYSIDPECQKFVSTEQIKTADETMWEFFFDQTKEISLDGYVPKLLPFRHQLVGTKYIHDCEYFALLWEMGTGKTKVVIDDISWHIKDREKPMNVLVICPKSIQRNWQNELEKNLPDDLEYFCERLNTHVSAVKQLMRGLSFKVPLRIWICGVDRVHQNFEALKMINFDLAILDESHRIKSQDARRSKACVELGKYCKRRVILTGTPVANNASDLFMQFQFLKAGCLGCDNKNQFEMRYDHIKLNGTLDRMKKSYAMGELKERLSKISLIVKKKDCLDLPEKTFSIREIEMTALQRDIYNQMAEFLMAELEGKYEGESTEARATVMIVQLLRLSQICNGFIKDVDGNVIQIKGENPKVSCIKEIIQEHPRNEKFIPRVAASYGLRKRALSEYGQMLGPGCGDFYYFG